jgi:hypothetical protein
MTPPVAAQALICSSVRLRGLFRTALALECEKTTGADDAAAASRLVWFPTW